MLDGRIRVRAERVLDPIGRGLHELGLSADVLTFVGVAVSVLTGLLIANGNLLLAVFGVIICGCLDLVDGSVARHSGTASARGAFIDSVCDRLADAALLGGVAWHLTSENAELPVLALGVLALTMLIPYERAKAESLGFAVRGGLMERAERMVLLAVGLAFDVLVPILWLMLALTALTAVHRFIMVWRQAGAVSNVGRRSRDRAEAMHASRGSRAIRRFRAATARPRGIPRVPGRR
ncbi:MAG: CDP-alcohol phosphatidyltransferase family protein [Actinobacteria bacterium]|nr:MAG: CDP-alcohol phosphatidyltransferase family protein [Actinomycetota bacterium]